MAAEDSVTWDLTAWFDHFDDQAFRDFREDYRGRLAALQRDARALGPLTAESVGVWGELIERIEACEQRASHLWSYLHCLSSADTRDEGVQRAFAEMSADEAEADKMRALVLDALRGCADVDFDALRAHPALVGLDYALVRRRQQAAMRMDRDLELLAADLGVDGVTAWGQLYQRIDGELHFEMPGGNGEPERVPMAWKRSLTQSADPEVRRAALRSSNDAWARMAAPVAAGLNAIAGTRLTLCRWRGVEDVTDVALYQSGISREILDAMMAATQKMAPTLRRYLKLKGRLIGRDALRFEDLNSPLPLGSDRRVSWGEGRRRVESAFGGYQGELGDFAKMAFDRRWIDAEPREGRRSGGFCTRSALTGEPRIFMTYQGTLGDVQTLAHELGHGFHGWLLKDVRPFAARYPMTLAETASMFAEAVLTDALIGDRGLGEEDRAAVLDTRLASAATSLLNIPMRYDFERAFYRERAGGEVSVRRLGELMEEAQRKWYGDALDPGALDPWFWASKLHFHMSRVCFYNFPYTFGYLFSLGVFARSKAEGPDFFETVKALLRQTGQGSPEALAREFLGVELSEQAFWLEAQPLLEADLGLFEDWSENARL